MTERVVGLTVSAFNEVAKLVNRGRVLPKIERRTRRVPGRSNGGVQLFHGVIIAACNTACGTYSITRVRRTMREGCDDCGSGSGSGSE